MTHDECVAEIMHRARARGCLAHYCGDSRRCRGDRGLPDLLIAGIRGSVWLEVKTDSGPGRGLNAGQTRWKHILIAAGHAHYVIHPWEMDKVDRLLEQLR